MSENHHGVVGPDTSPHAFTTRIGGVSVGPFASLNLGNPSPSTTCDSDTHLRENYRRLSEAVGLTSSTFRRTRQVHGRRVITARSGDPIEPRDQLKAEPYGLGKPEEHPEIAPHDALAEPPGVDGEMIDLENWLNTNNPTEGAKWTLTQAVGVSDNGWITGQGQYNDGSGEVTRAFLLDASSLVPEPAALPAPSPKARRKRGAEAKASPLLPDEQGESDGGLPPGHRPHDDAREHDRRRGGRGVAGAEIRSKSRQPQWRVKRDRVRSGI